MAQVARLARAFVAAHKRRHRDYPFATLNERAALDSLRDHIASLDLVAAQAANR